ncbi:hypothetical protein AB4Y43_16585 [Paraburkholderia sp. BR10872]|uniref:hypothetical protein n=1 Tax=Paraburkholderia sp. BR10872 TaxID=3236989 RepID=UPI0034D283C8
MAEKERLRLNGHVNRARDQELFDALNCMDDRLRMGRLRELANLGLRAEAVLRAGTERRLGEHIDVLGQSAPPVPRRPQPAPQQVAETPSVQRPVTAPHPEPSSSQEPMQSQPASSTRKRMLGMIDTSIMN